MLDGITRKWVSLNFKWQRHKLICVTLFLYICFCVSCSMIPDSVLFGESLCFAYIFSMMQMIEVAFFIRGENLHSLLLMCVTLFTASVMPTIQMYQVMTGGYSREIGDMCSYIYMLKEVGMYLAMRDSTVRGQSITQISYTLIVLIWVIIETVFFFSIGDSLDYEGAIKKAVSVARLAPQFFMALITTLAQINQGV